MKLFGLVKGNISIIVFIACLFAAIYVGGTLQPTLLMVALGVMLVTKKENIAICFIAQTFMCDNLEVMPSFSFASIAALILIVRCLIIGKTKILSHKKLFVILSLFAVHLLSVAFWNNTIINVVRFIMNIFVLYYYMHFSEIFKKKSPVLLPSVISITVMLASLLGLNSPHSVDEFGIIRFSGIWIDDNFCGMYCILGIISSIYAVILSRKTILFAVPSIIISVYMGSLAMSRTFIYVMIILAFLLMVHLSLNKSFGKIYKLFLVFACVAGTVYFLNHIASSIIEHRGIISDTGDVTNGRLTASLESLEAWEKNPVTWFTGIGASNTYNYKILLGIHPKGSHNTYLDFLVEFGVFAFIYILCVVVKFLRKFISEISYTLPYTVFFAVVVLFYMGTLTMCQYSIIYIAFGMIFNYLNTPPDSNNISNTEIITNR